MTMVQSILASTLLRTLESDASISPVEAATRVVASAPSLLGMDLDSAALRSYVEELAGSATHHAVLNPTWSPAGKSVRFHYFLVNAQAGWLPLLIAQTRASTGVSHHILYGTWDSLIIMHGTEERAAKLLAGIQEMSYFASDAFAASNVLYYCRRLVPLPTAKPNSVDIRTVNALIDDYDALDFKGDRHALEASGVLLGPTWRIDRSTGAALDSFIGVSVRGGGVSAQEMLASLLRDDVVRSCLVNFVEIERGIPFHYVAFVTCRDAGELDHVTDYVSFLRVGRARLETVTYIVAQGRSDLLRIDDETDPDIHQAPDFSRAEDIGMATLLKLGPEATGAFNALDGPTQLVVLSSFDDIREQIAQRDWDEERHNRILGAQRLFIAAVLEHLTPAEVEAPALAISNAVEGAMQQTLAALLTPVYGRDVARAQNDLHLPTRDVGKISMGKGVVAFRAMRDVPQFAAVAGDLGEDWVVRLQAFSEGRNRWAHASGPSEGTPKEIIGGLSRFLVEGIRLVRWLARVRFSKDDGHPSLPTAQDSQPPESPVALGPSRDRSGTFLSYSSVDVEVASRIASGLRVLDPRVWFAEWSIGPSDSIVERINEGLARSDTLVVVLTASSITSKWVQRELDAALMHQLRGADVVIVPLLVEDCALPEVLVSIKYIDMRGGRFYEGFVELMEFIKSRASR